MNNTDMTETKENEENEEELDNEENEDKNDNKILTKIERSMKELQKVNKLFKRNECENSFYILAQTNKFRIFCMKLIINKWFDRFILIIILLSITRLIADPFVKGYFFVFAFEIFKIYYINY